MVGNFHLYTCRNEEMLHSQALIVRKTFYELSVLRSSCDKIRRSIFSNRFLEFFSVARCVLHYLE